MPTPEEFAAMNPESECACGDPLSMHLTIGARWCLRGDCGCSGFTTPAEMEEIRKTIAIKTTERKEEGRGKNCSKNDEPVSKKKILAIVGASILALSGVAKLVKDNTVERHAVIVAANERYTNYLTQSNISLQILYREVLATNEKIKKLKSPGPAQDYVDVINRNIDASSQFYADLNRNADEASKLIDALPSSYSDLRKERDKTVDSVQSIRKELAALIAKKSDVPTRYLETQLFAEKIVNLDISVIKWGDKAMRAADETIEQQDAKVKALNRAVNVLVPLAAVFGLIAAFSGVKVEGSD